MRQIGLWLCSLLMSGVVLGQSTITLEDIWKNGTYYHKRVPGFNFMNDGKHYTRLEDNAIVKYDLTTGNKVEELLKGNALKNTDGFDGEFESYQFSADESRILVMDNVESIYRRSYKANYYIYNRESRALTAVYNDKIQYASLDPSNTKVAFVYKNNVYYKDLNSSKVTQITNDGEINAIINGATDWVYEEEFAFAKAFAWNADGTAIAFLRFDERAVPEFTMTWHRNQAYPIYDTFKYPKVGEKNSTVTAHIYSLKKDKTVAVDLAGSPDTYYPRIKWTTNPNELCVFQLNRHQNELTLYLASAKTGKTKQMLRETNKYYIDITDDLTFLKDGKHFIWSSEQSGYNHLYLYKKNGQLVKPLTEGEWDVMQFQGLDAAKGDIYYTAADKSPMQKHVYRLNMESAKVTALTPFQGVNSCQFSSNYDYFVNINSTINTAPTYKVYDRNLDLVRTIEDNSAVAESQKLNNVKPVEFFDFTTKDDVKLNGFMIKPKDFDASNTYPVFMYLYGGPGSQQVEDAWKGSYYWWFQMIADMGYVVACVDNRGTGARGEEFKKMTYMQLGKYETIDQIEAAKYLGGLPYTDASRIGIFGWSYGGYMSSLCLLKGNDVFKAAIAVAPVTNWRWYDSVYTERYMRTYAENQAGYDDNSPVNFADQLKGNYLLIHGMADDNVHFQNAAEMTNALISANKQFDTYYYPNRNHGIYGDNARLHLFTKMTNFINEKL